MTAARRGALAFGAVTILLVPIAYASMFSVFNAYDDEGYFLMTLRDYLSGHALFSDASTLYGPFFYEVMGGLFKVLGVEVTTDSGRMVTMVIWLLASLAGAAATLRLTRSLLLGIGAQFVTFHALAALTSEPMQPAGLLSLLLIAMVAAAAYRSTRPRATAVVIGLAVAALCLVKINVGLFAGLALVFASAAGAGRWRKVLLPATGALMVAIPFVLMAGLLNQEWVVEYALVAGLSAAGVTFACLAVPPMTASPPALIWIAGSATVLAIACLGIAILGGTHPAALFDAIVAVPANLPQLYVWPLRINAGYVIWAGASLGAAILGVRTVIHVSPAIRGVARIAVGALTWLAVLLLPSSLLFLAVPLAWVATQDPRKEAGGPTDPYARLLLPALAVTESLQAYPIAGTQLSMAALMLVPIGAIALNDGIGQLREYSARDSRRSIVAIASWAAPMAVIVNLAFYQLFAFLAVSAYQSTQPLGLHGAELVRVAPHRAAAVRSLVAAINQECSTFITLPGMASLYLWTGQRPPAQLYAGVWMYLLDPAQQQHVVIQVQAEPRLCVVRDQTVVDFWAEGRPIPDRPLVDYIVSSFAPSGTFGDYELLVRN